MASIEEMRRQQQERQEWAACDPFTLVAAARQALYDELGAGTKSKASAPIEEALSRFDQLARASVGTVTSHQQQPV